VVLSATVAMPLENGPLTGDALKSPVEPTIAVQLPSGTDLADARNFGLLPPVEDLEQGAADPEEFRQRLSHHLAFATKLLHTSGVAAAVWREWRTFEKIARQKLQELGTRAALVSTN
jgi:hypothetical protein